MVTGADPEAAGELLRDASWNVKAAIVMKKAGLSYTQAVRRLKKSNDSIREAIGEDLEPILRKLLDGA
jgi:N-acetylmuramic acid 6-phosphate (MurNAc-6-P) etherase